MKGLQYVFWVYLRDKIVYSAIKSTYIVERFGKRSRNVLIAHVAFSSNMCTRCEKCTCSCWPCTITTFSDMKKSQQYDEDEHFHHFRCLCLLFLNFFFSSLWVKLNFLLWEDVGKLRFCTVRRVLRRLILLLQLKRLGLVLFFLCVYFYFVCAFSSLSGSSSFFGGRHAAIGFFMCI